MNRKNGPGGIVAKITAALGELKWRRPVPVLLILLATAALVRTIGIASRPIWYDEAFSILFAEKGPAAIFPVSFAPGAPATADVHPLGYYLILWEWMRLFGESLQAVRALSVLAGTATIGVVYLLARDLFGSRTALAAAAIGALAPFQVHYGQEIRMYVFMSLWLLLATYCFWRGSIAGHWGWWWLGFAVFAAAAVITQYLGIFYLAALAVWPLLMRQWRVLRNVALSAGIAVLLISPWLLRLPTQFAKVSQVYWIERPGISRFLTLILVYVTNLPLPGWLLWTGLFAALALLAFAVRETVNAVCARNPSRWRVIWVLYLAFVPPLLLFLFSQWIPLYVERALLPSGIAFGIWLAWSLAAQPIKRPVGLVAVVFTVLGFSMGLFEHWTYAGFPYAPFPELAANLEAERGAGDAIVHSSKLSLLPSMYFDRNLPQVYIADTPGTPVDTLDPETQRIIGVHSAPNIGSAVGNAVRVWYVIFDESNREYVQAGYPEHPDLTWLRQHYSFRGLGHWGELGLYLFSKDP